jgi:hypothetical protein
MQHHISRATCAALIAASMVAAHPARAANNLLLNPAFNTPSGTGPTSFTGIGPGPSAALDWEVFNNTDATTTTDLEPSTLVRGGTMIHVVAGADRDGLAQAYFQSNGHTQYACAWIYLVSGTVAIGAGLDGGQFGALLLDTGAWEVLNVSAVGSPTTEMELYASGGPAEFYVESASVSDSHGQCKPM